MFLDEFKDLRIEKLIETMSAKSMDLMIDIVKALIVLVLGIMLVKTLSKIMVKALSKTKLDESVYSFIISIVKIFIYVMLAVILLSIFGVPTTPIITMIGASGAAIALALKDSLSDVASGLIILIKKPFVKDDVILVQNYEGKVVSTDITVTTINTFDGQTITIPNRMITGSILINETNSDVRRLDLFFSIAYSDDIARAREVILNIVDTHECVLEEPSKPSVIVAEHGDSAIVLKLMVWLNTEEFYDTKAAINEEVKIGLEEAGITIPFPQMDVHIVK